MASSARLQPGLPAGEPGKGDFVQTKDMLGARYRLDHRIATGGMGDVWAARDELLGRRVAVKLLHPHLAADDAFRRRFRAEAMAAARLSHPGIVAVFDYGEGPDGAYLAMELVEGEPLNAVVERRGRLDPIETTSLVAQTAEALAAAHAEGLVHRDVKPANLLLRPDGRVKVTDFGIVRAVGSATMTHEGTVLGTVAYMSPEQVRGERVTGASDIYSLGVVAYECLAGVRPFGGSESISVALAHLHDRVPDLPRDVPPALRRLVSRMLEKDPAARPPSAAAVAAMARRAGGAVLSLTTYPLVEGPGATAPEAPDDGSPTELLAPEPPAGEPTEDLALAGVAQPQTMALHPPRAGDFRTRTPRRQWVPVALTCALALALALVLGAVVPSRGALHVQAAGAASTTPARVTVPPLDGTTLGTAEHQLRSLGLRARTVQSHPSLGALVVAEQPGAGAHVRRGALVRLDTAPPEVRPPSNPAGRPATAPERPAPTAGLPVRAGPPGHAKSASGNGHDGSDGAKAGHDGSSTGKGHDGSGG